MNDWSTQLVSLVQDAPLWAGLMVLFFGAFIEYVFPPFPGDTLLIAGGFLAAHGALPLWPTLGILTLGSLGGMCAGWLLGRLARNSMKIRNILFRWFHEDSLSKIETAYTRYGVGILIANRFLPGIRGVFVFGAGLGNIPLRKILVYGLLSACLWNSLLVFAGVYVSKSLPQLLELFQEYTRFMVIALLSALAVFVLMKIYRKHRKK